MYALNVLGTRIDPVNIPDVIKKIEQLISNNEKGYITVTGVHGIIEALYSYDVRVAHNNAALTVPDGMPLVWIGRLKGFKNISRCYGPDLFLEVLEDSVLKGYKHFFYGGDEGVAEDLKEKMEDRFPGIKIAGTFTPPFRPLSSGGENELKAMIYRTTPDIFWVGLSTPKQELFMYNYMTKLNTKVMIGVGAAFDFNTGRKKQAPKLIQKIGMEWFYRLLKEPGRLWKRYFKIVPLFIILYMIQVIGLRMYDEK